MNWLLFMFIPFSVFAFHKVFSSSGAKQNAKGGCQRQIKALMLMHCSNMKKTDAAPQHRLSLEKYLPSFNE